jgi:nucleoside-diphosphate-sugar epimerase
MRIFVTGATGYIGSAVTSELTAAGHAVTGLVRNEEKAAVLRRLGAEPVVGSLKEPATYRAQAAAHEVLIHTAFESSPEAVASDRTAIETLLAAARQGEARELVYTSGIWVLGATADRPAGEDSPTDHPAALVAWRPPHEQMVLAAATDRLATAVIRPGVVYGGHGGLIGDFFHSAEEEGAAKHVGDGNNRIPLIHLDDLARFYRAVVEHHARGIFHAVDGTALRLAEVARAASAAAGKQGATRQIPLPEARRNLGPFADALALDQIVVSRRAAELAWRPQHPSFLAEAANAYQEWKAATAL